MRKTLVTTLLITIAFTMGSCYLDGWNHGITGNGNVREETRDADGFSGIHVSTGIDVYLSEGTDFSVVVEADENLLDVILTEVKGDMLEVRTDHVNIRRARSKRVHVTLPELKEVKISSAGDLEGQTLFHCRNLRLEVSSAGDLLLEVEAREIDLNISSSGDIRLAGSADFLDASLSSAGDLDAGDLVARKVEVDVSSAGDARVHATDEISMNASSAGNIYYSGDPRVIRSKSSSAGDIIKRD